MALHSLGKTAEARDAFYRGRKWSEDHPQTAYMLRWKNGSLHALTPGMVRRLEAEAAAMLGVTDGQVQAAAPSANVSNP
jgi:hypothetical protein